MRRGFFCSKASPTLCFIHRIITFSPFLPPSLYSVSSFLISLSLSLCLSVCLSSAKPEHVCCSSWRKGARRFAVQGWATLLPPCTSRCHDDLHLSVLLHSLVYYYVYIVYVHVCIDLNLFLLSMSMSVIHLLYVSLSLPFKRWAIIQLAVPLTAATHGNRLPADEVSPWVVMGDERVWWVERCL